MLCVEDTGKNSGRNFALDMQRIFKFEGRKYP
jgi:hypothetical protein